MLLSGDLLEQITSTLNRGSGAPATAPAPGVAGESTSEQRRETRVGIRADVTVIPLADRLQTPAFEVSLRDLSAGGIGFVHTEKMALDEQFVVLLPEDRESVAVLCQVAYYQPLADRGCAIGARFVRVLRQPTPRRVAA